MQVINTNSMSLNSQRELSRISSSLATSIQRLSSGLRINNARDDAAGLAISERFTTQIRGLGQAARNANDGISMAQTAEGALAQITGNLQRIRELAVQSRNATNSASDRAALDAEVGQLKMEIQRVAEQTAFNGVRLLDGSFVAQVFQVGANHGETITLAGMINAYINALGRWDAPDTAPTTDPMPGQMNLPGDDDTNPLPMTFGQTGDEVGFAEENVLTPENADRMIIAMDAALEAVNDARARLGAAQNRFHSVVANLHTTGENLSASRSRIMDTDFALEAAELTRTRILQQTGTAMLAQANRAPQNVLELLR